MKAFVTSIGEKTTGVCVRQLIRYGFEVHLLDKKEPWIEKYKRFLVEAQKTGEDVLRIDADNIPNRNIAQVPEINKMIQNAYIIQFQLFGFYKYDVITGGPLIYKRSGLSEMVKHLDKITELRPETSLSRLPQINPHLVTCPIIMGTHGFFQDKETMQRAYNNKMKRNQLHDCDFQLADELMNL